MTYLLADRYDVGPELGRGAMGVVFRAIDTRLQRPVAIKVMAGKFEELGEPIYARFQQEARLIASLQHPNIVSVYDLGESAGEPFIVMELVEGESLTRRPPQTQDAILAITRQICAALDHAHVRGLVHRDLKPDNILLLPDGSIKLMDFGLARLSAAAHLTHEGVFLGTPTYTAPEQALGQEVDGRADLYALGVMLYEWFTGRPPFTESDPLVVIAQHIHARVPAPRSIQPNLAPGLEEIILKLLEKDPAERFGSAPAVMDALQNFAQGIRLPQASAPRHNLPPTRTGFVGRQPEAAEVLDLLKSNRLVTLIGPGGAGKTRLSLYVAEKVLSHYPDGVWQIELAPLADSRLVSATVAASFGLREKPDEPVLITLSEHLRNQQLLLILDNCEHVVAACAQLAEGLLRNCPNLTILTTSREALNIEGETTFSVPPLSLPNADHESSLTALTGYEAVKLFTQRAALAQPGFALSRENATTVVQICRALDGLPLAIELAAARVKTLQVEQILARLDDRFNLLKGGSRTAQPRQQTLRSLIDWGYDLLTPAEQVLLCRLAVFAGGATLEAIEQTVAALPNFANDPLATPDLLDLVSQLVSKSFVVLEREPGGEARYRLLETIRHYAEEKLADTHSTAALEILYQRHLHYYLRLAETAEPYLRRSEQMQWWGRLAAEVDNLRVALEWGFAHANTLEAGVRLSAALSWFWWTRGNLREGRQWMERALSAANEHHMPGALRARLLDAFGVLAVWQGEFASAQQLFDESLALRQSLGDKAGLAASYIYLGMLAEFQINFEAAKEACEQALALYRELGDNAGIAEALNALGLVVAGQGDPHQAQILLEGNLAWFQNANDQAGIAHTQVALGFAYLFQGQFETAQDFLIKSLLLHQALGDKVKLNYGFGGLAAIANVQGQPARAARMLGLAEVLRERAGFVMPPRDHQTYDLLVGLVKAQLAPDALNQAWATGRTLTVEEGIQFVLEATIR